MKKNKEKLKLQRDAKILLLIAGLFIIALGLSNTFVNIYIWRIKKDFVAIGIYNLFIHITLPLTFILAGYISKKRDGTSSIRIGIILHTLFFMIIFLLKEDAVNYLIHLGSFLGIAGGFYWLGFHMLTFDLTNGMNRDTFNSYNGIVGSLSGMFAPLAAGFIITAMKGLTGYYIIFGISFLIFVVVIIISLFLHTKRYGEKFRLIQVIKESSTSWQSIMVGSYFFGIRNGVLMFFINLLIFIVLKSELSIGKITLIGALVSTISFELIERIMKPPRRKSFIKIGTIMMFVSVLILLYKINFLSIVIFTIVNAFFFPFFTVPFNSASYNILDKTNQEKNRTEYIVFKELVLNLGRITGIIAFIIAVANTKDILNLKTLILIIGSSQLVIPFLLKFINKDAEVL